ncbi:salivary C-type lectin 1-like [Glandiceps talaboti]
MIKLIFMYCVGVVLAAFRPPETNHYPLNEGFCAVELDGTGDCDCIVFEFFCQQTDGQFQAEAKAHCESLGGYLAIIDTDQKSQAVRNYIRLCEFESDWCIPNKGFWIGLSDSQTEGQYIWSDDTGVCQHSFDWAAGEPNNNDKKDDNGQDCVQLWYRSRSPAKWGKWDDEYCAVREKAFICEFKIPYCNYEEFWNRAEYPPPCPGDEDEEHVVVYG